MKKPIIPTLILTMIFTGTLIANATLPPLTPPPSGGYDSGLNSILDPGCAPNTLNCWVNLPTGGSVTANNGLTASGSNVQLGGTLLQDTVIDQAGYNLFTKRSINTYNGEPGSYEFGFGNATSLGGFLNGVGNYALATIDAEPTLTSYVFNGIGQGGELGVAPFIGEMLIDSTTGNTLSSKMIAFGDQELILSSRRESIGDSSQIAIRPTSLQFDFLNSGVLSSYTFPRTDGLANQVLTTDGSGQLSWQNAGGSSGWSLTGNSGTTAGTNFIGTTDAQDFVVKTNGNQIALFGQQGNIAFGSDNTGIDPSLTPPTASNVGSVAFQSGQATGVYSTAFGVGQASGDVATSFGSANASGVGSMAWGIDSVGNTVNPVASGETSTAWGNRNTIASGHTSTAFGSAVLARSRNEVAFGYGTVDYTPLSTTSNNDLDRLLSIGNGGITPHNAYTLWKDGSFAYNDDNFQNDDPGTEQNMFYFNYGNHDGLGGVNTKRAIRLGSSINNEWNINDANVGDGSIVFGFASYPGGTGGSIASGTNSVAFGSGNISSEESSFAFGQSTTASGVVSTSFGGGTIASEYAATAFGNNTIASGHTSTAWGESTHAFGSSETAFGLYNTAYSPTLSITDRLLTIGNGSGTGFESDAFTILGNGQTGVGIDNFEANTNGNIFQVGDGNTGIIGYVDNGTGNWMAVSDERKKHNITDIQYGLNEILKLKPVSFDYNRNNEHTIGFLAQQVLPIIPEAVGGDAEKGYSMSYATLTPALVKAIQELNLKVDTLQLTNGTTSTNIFDSLKNWFGDVGNGIEEFVVGTLRARNQICIDDVCMNKDQLRAILNTQGGLTNTPVLDSPGILPNTETLPNENIDSSINDSEGLLDSISTSIDDPINNTETVVQNSGDIVSDTQ